MPTVAPRILTWARETAGLTPEEAVTKLGIKDARGVSAVDRLAAMEKGNAEITRAKLLKFAKVYHRPLLTFYMGAPPPRGDRGEDFRTLPERRTASEPLVDALVRDIRARQSMVRSILEDEEEAQRLPIIGSMSMNDGVGSVLASIRRMLEIDLMDFRAQGSAEAAFTFLRGKVESVGIFVLLMGNLGSHHTSIDTTAFRGFALSDPIAPFIVINDQDAKTAWSFTLLHELAHLWLGATGVSGALPEGPLEQFCNDVASAFLLPGNEIAAVGVRPATPLDEAAGLISAFAEDRLVSRSLVAYRLFRADLLTHELWQQLTQRFRAEWMHQRALRRERDRENNDGPNYYVVRRHRIGPALLQFVARNLSEGVLTPTKASKVLGVKPRSVQPLISGAVARRVA